MKTSSRSAKDSPIASEKLARLFKDYVAELATNERTNENKRLICMLKAAFQCLKLTTAVECIDMFIRSERIYQDMLLAIAIPHRFQENFVIRKFFEIDVDMEFRGFVFDRKLTAVSQYNYLIHSERLCENKTVIANNIQTYYESIIAKKLADANFLKNFVIDFAVFSSNLN